MKRMICICILAALLASFGCAFAVDDSIQISDIMGELKGKLGSFDSAGIVQELKALLKDTESLTDDQLRKEIRALAQQHKVKLTDGQVDQLVSLCRALEKADADEIKEKIESAQDTLKKFSDAQKKAAGFLQRIKTAVQNVSEFLSNLFGRFRAVQ